MKEVNPNSHSLFLFISQKAEGLVFILRTIRIEDN